MKYVHFVAKEAPKLHSSRNKFARSTNVPNFNDMRSKRSGLTIDELLNLIGRSIGDDETPALKNQRVDSHNQILTKILTKNLQFTSVTTYRCSLSQLHERTCFSSTHYRTTNDRGCKKVNVPPYSIRDDATQEACVDPFAILARDRS